MTQPTPQPQNSKEKKKQYFYYWKMENGINWIGLSSAHNKREEIVVENYIRKQLKISLAKTFYKKELNGKIIKKWNY